MTNNDNRRADKKNDGQYVRLPQGKATNNLISASLKRTKKDKLGRTTIVMNGWKLTIEKGKMNMNTDASKLLDWATVKLLKNNNFRPKIKQKINTTVEFSLRDFGEICGKNVAESKNALDNFRKTVKKSLDVLYNISLSWTEPSAIFIADKNKNSKRAKKNFVDIRILQKKGIRNGIVLMQFTDDFSEYLLNAYIMKYPLSLFFTDGRNPNTYAIGRKLVLIHGMNKNQKRRRANIISVEKLLQCAPNIDLYEEIQEKDPGHWKSRMQNPLEISLNDIVELGVISGWNYCGSKEKKLLEKEIKIMCSNYELWSKSYIHFDM